MEIKFDAEGNIEETRFINVKYSVLKSEKERVLEEYMKMNPNADLNDKYDYWVSIIVNIVGRIEEKYRLIYIEADDINTLDTYEVSFTHELTEDVNLKEIEKEMYKISEEIFKNGFHKKVSINFTVEKY